jgi:hypothetical protein
VLNGRTDRLGLVAVAVNFRDASAEQHRRRSKATNDANLPRLQAITMYGGQRLERAYDANVVAF